ncbi:hypothetical protein K458DRAFT_119366 [Lentithecium fluviatile CBS 122367]|uniref:F-box domain-containing protein n=1 Tax=Lentithecium fluviatile CBS 122367 TaxID=1168545 RepID=A0A6G1ILW7_9PLEO|nr:hypothetical protein K458DRAFT_119366 [Lentithecium fluviatile CBS 122367]
MGFLDLAPEIIDVIIDLSLPLGLEGLALTCKALYGRAKSQIERHNALKRRWRCADNYSTPTRSDTLGILHEISLDPLVAEYIEVLDLWDRRTSLDYPENIAAREGRGGGYNFRADAKAMEKIWETVTGSAFYIHANLENAREWWASLMEQAVDGTPIVDLWESWRAMAMLLGLLTNLRVLRLSPFWIEAPYHDSDGAADFLRGFAGMVSAANAENGPLSKLEVVLPFMSDGYDSKVGLQSLQPLMTLNSLTEMYLVGVVAVDDGYTGIPFEWGTPGLKSSLRRLELVNSCIDAEGLSNLVAHTPKLEIFKYSHSTKNHGCQHDWNPGTFIEALARHCSNTILEVALTIDELSGDIVNGASSFLALPNIQKLEVDIQVFCGPPVESGQRLGENAVIPQGDRPWNKEDIPCIGSMVPNNVREVQINTGYPNADPTALLSLLKNLRQQRAERLHALERVIIRQYGGNSAQEIADWSGATLEAFEEDVHEMRLRTSMPQWKREFEDRVRSLARGE